MTDEELATLLETDDDFRLAIRGATAIEKMIDNAILDALPGRWKGNVRRFGGFESRLSLAVALAIVPETWMLPIRELAKLRNDFAHGTIEHLTRARVMRLVRSIEPIVENLDELQQGWKDTAPTMLLKDVISVIHWGVRYCIRWEVERRYEAGVAAIVAGDRPKKIMEKWKAEGSPGA